MRPGSLPDTVIVDDTGTAYMQSHAKDGRLGASDRGDFIVLAGTFTPRSDDGRACPASVTVNYGISKAVGVIFIEATLQAPRRDSFRVREFACLNSMGDREVDGANNLYLMRDPTNWLYAVVPDRAKRQIDSGRYAFATWGSGAIAMQAHSASYEGAAVAQEVYERAAVAQHGDPNARKFMTIGTRNTQRYIDFVLISQPPGSEIELTSDRTITYALSLLPWKKYRPRIEFVGVISDHDESNLLRVARDGATALVVGFDYPFTPFTLITAPSTISLERLPAVAASFHKYGIRMLADFQGNWLDVTKAINAGLYTPEQATRDRIVSRMNWEKGIPEGFWPDGPQSLFCMNAPQWRHTLSDAARHVVTALGADGIYVDGDAVWPCQNTDHGCSSAASFPAVGSFSLWSDVRRSFDELAERKDIFTHSANGFRSTQSFADMTNPGETGGQEIYDDAAYNLVYNSLLYGTQCVYYTGTWGINPDSPRAYERALSRCAVVWIQVEEDPSYPGTLFTGAKLDLFHKYMSPLRTFDVENSEVHHPFDPDYERYAQVNVEGVTPVVYARPGDLLVVVAKEGETSPPADVVLWLDRLGFSGKEVLVFDTISGKLATRAADNRGRLTLRNMPVADGPQILRILQKPASPQVVWHDHIVWDARPAARPSPARLRLEVAGVPDSRGTLAVYCGAHGSPVSVIGGSLLDCGGASGLATIAVDFPETARKRVSLAFAR